MSYYRKFISYIDLYEYEEKTKNIGFVKCEIRDDIWKLKVNIRGLEITDTVMCEMKTVGAQEYLDRFQIIKGHGQFESEYEIAHLAGTEISYANVCGLIFQLSSHKYGKCTWAQDNHTYHSVEGERAYIKAMEQKSSIEPKKPIQEDHIGYKNEAGNKTDNMQGAFALPEYQLNSISGNKWMQLGRMYPAIHPFHEISKGEYISLKPKDFVILHEKYQTLVNNSFLLHGYFNYRHIILGKRTEGQQIKYYIGVPGTFHEREKMVAVMFGFEEFEGVDSEERGAFGYYMKEVRI